VRAKAWPGDRDEVEVQGLVAGEDGGKKQRTQQGKMVKPRKAGTKTWARDGEDGVWGHDGGLACLVLTSASLYRWKCSGDLR
jgi:hypothetical protein